MIGQQVEGLLFRNKLLEILDSYQQSQILITCNELGVFKALSKVPANAQELAARLGTSERGMRILLDAAVAVGFLQLMDGCYSNTPPVQACLVEEGPFFLGNLIRLEENFYRRWGQLDQAVVTGTAASEHAHREDPEWVKIFEAAMYDMARDSAPVIAEMLHLPDGRPLRSIDLGGGHGYYSVALAKHYPNLTATVFDLPRVGPFARDFISKTGYASRVFVKEGDFIVDDLGSDYDLALVFGVMGGQSPENRPVLLKRAFDTLKPGGKIALHDCILNPDRTSPLSAALFAAWMLAVTKNGEVGTTEEFSRFLVQAGFTNIEIQVLPEWTEMPLITAEKPDQ